MTGHVLRYSLFPLMLVALFLSHNPSAYAQIPAGKRFVVALPSFWSSGNRLIPGPGDAQISIMCARRTNVTVKWSYGDILDQAVINAGDRLTIQPPTFQTVNLMQLDGDRALPDEVNQRSFLIEADQLVTVQVTYDFSGMSETYTVPPIEAYDKSYQVITYSGHGFRGKRSGVLVSASEDNTSVTITPTVTAGDEPLHPPSTPFTLTMQKYEVYELVANSRDLGYNSDLTGTIISSDKPIGMIAFNQRSSAPREVYYDTIVYVDNQGNTVVLVDSTYTDFIYDSKPMANPVLSIENAGTMFYTVPFGRQARSTLVMTATEDGTEIYINDVQLDDTVANIRPGTIKPTFNRGDFEDTYITGPTIIRSTKPILVMQCAESNDIHRYDKLVTGGGPMGTDTTFSVLYGNPFMALLPPVNTHKLSLQWVSPELPQRYYRSSNSDSLLVLPWEHYVLITAPADGADSVLLDGNPVDLNISYPDGKYVSGIIPIPPRQHRLTANVPISAIAYGFGWNDSYGTITGEGVRSAARLGLDTIRLSTCDSTANFAVPISNIGNLDFKIDSIRTIGIELKRILWPTGFPQQIIAGRDPVTMDFVVRLPQPRTYTGTLRLFTDANSGKIIEIPFIITRDSAQLGIPTSIDFGVVPASISQKDTCIVIRNNGTQPMTINTLSFSKSEFQLLSSTPITIEPGKTDSICIGFTPNPGSPVEGNLSILGEPCFTPISIPVSGFQGAGASLAVARSLNYSSYLCSAPDFVDTTIVIRSVGDEPVTITDEPTFGGNNPTLFAMITSLKDKVILPGDSIVATVRYTPLTFGRHSAIMTLKTTAVNLPTVDIDLRGSKDTAMAQPSVTTYDFGQITSCGDPLEYMLTLMNDGTIDATITSIDGLEDSPFVILSSPTPLTVPLRSEQSVTVRFDPQSDGDFTATLRLRGDPCGIDETVILTGTRVSPELTAVTTTIQMDTVYLCEDGTSGTITLTNSGPIPVDLERVTPAGDAAFSLVGFAPVTLAPNQSQNYTVAFAPTTDGDYSGSIEFIWGPCSGTTTVAFSGVAVQPAASISAATIDFGQVNITAGQATQTITLTNDGRVPRTISSIDLGGITGLQLLQPSPLPVTIPPGGTVDITVGYDPDVQGTLAATATIAINAPCSEQKSITIQGEAIGEDIILTQLSVSVPAFTGMVDSRVNLPVEIISSTNLANAAPTSMRVRLHYRYTLLAPTDVSSPIPGMTATLLANQIVNDERVLEIELAGGTFPAQGTVANVNCLVLLGDTDVTPVVIDTVLMTFPPNRQPTYAWVNGEFTALGICRIDGDRFVRLGSALKLTGTRPNPFHDVTEIEFTVEQEGAVELVIMDRNGNEVERLVEGSLSEGVYSVMFNGSRLASGVYFCELRRGAERIRKQLVLVQ